MVRAAWWRSTSNLLAGSSASMPSSRSRAAAGIPSRGAEKCSLTLEYHNNRQDLICDNFELESPLTRRVYCFLGFSDWKPGRWITWWMTITWILPIARVNFVLLLINIERKMPPPLAKPKGRGCRTSCWSPIAGQTPHLPANFEIKKKRKKNYWKWKSPEIEASSQRALQECSHNSKHRWRARIAPLPARAQAVCGFFVSLRKSHQAIYLWISHWPVPQRDNLICVRTILVLGVVQPEW